MGKTSIFHLHENVSEVLTTTVPSHVKLIVEWRETSDPQRTRKEGSGDVQHQKNSC